MGAIHPAVVTTKTAPLRVLVVDDEPNNLKLLSEALLGNGYEVFVAADGLDALDAFHHHQPDLVLLDVVMPGMDGFDTCRRLKALPGCDPQVVFLTAMQDSDAVIKGFEAGGADYVTKPFDLPVLLARVRTHASLGRINKDFRYNLDQRGLALKSADRRLTRLSRELAATEERERRQLAENLHDGPIQDLALARIQLEMALIDPDPLVQTSSLNACAQLLRGSLGSLRTLLFDISPPAMTGAGLPSALQRLATHISDRGPMQVDFRCRGTPEELEELEEGRMQALFRAARELLVNATKHAGSEGITMELTFGNHQVCVTIHDHGKGFDPHTINRGSYGLNSVRERLALFGGSLMIDSDHHGTRAKAQLPLRD